LLSYRRCLYTVLFIWTASTAAEQPVIRDREISLTESELNYLHANIPSNLRRQVETDPSARYELFANTLVSKRIKHRLDAMTVESERDAFLHYQFALLVAAREFDEKLFQRNLATPDFTALAEERYRVSHDEIAAVPEVRYASHILLLCGDECEEAAIVGELSAIQQQLAEGASFEQLAQERSQDPGSKLRGGRLSSGITQRDQKVDGSFRDAVFAMTVPGDVSATVKSRFGYHIIRLDSITPAYERPFEDVREVLIAEIEKRFRADAYQLYLLGLAPQDRIEMDYGVIDAVFGALPPDDAAIVDPAVSPDATDTVLKSQ